MKHLPKLTKEEVETLIIAIRNKFVCDSTDDDDIEFCCTSDALDYAYDMPERVYKAFRSLYDE